MQGQTFIVKESITIIDPVKRLIRTADGELIRLHSECPSLTDEIYEYLFMEGRKQSKTES